jgi:GNAT superfamily N-acetyltransferase
MGAEIRAATADEAPNVVTAYDWLFAPPGGRPRRWDRARAQERLRVAAEAEASVVLVADEDGAIVGFCTAYLDVLSVRFGRRVWVEDLAVHPERRSRGIGKALLDAAKDWGRERGATHLELDSGRDRTDAHRFYQRENPNWTSISFAWEL